MPRRPAITLFDLLDQTLDELMGVAKANLRATVHQAIRDSGIPTQLPGPVPAQNAAPQRQKRARKGQQPIQTPTQAIDLYAILEISRNASQETITGAYRALARKYHPDTNPGSWRAEEKMRRAVNYAYSVLGDKDKRKVYDKENREAKRGGHRAAQ